MTFISSRSGLALIFLVLTAILAGSEEEKINGVIADSPFANLTSYLEDNLSYWTNLPSIPFNWTIINSIRLITKNFSSASQDIAEVVQKI